MNAYLFRPEHPDDVKTKPDVCEEHFDTDMVRDFPDSLPYCPVCRALEDSEGIAELAYKHA